MTSSQEIVTIVNIKVNQSKTRQEGFEYLLDYLELISSEHFMQYSSLWITKAIQELENTNNVTNILNQTCKTIGSLIIAVREIPELNKIVSMQYVKQIINIISHFESNRLSGGIFYLISVLLHYYPESCTRLQEPIKKVILTVIDSSNQVLVASGAKCFTLLSKAIQRSFKPLTSKPNHTGYMYQEYLICNTLHLIFNEILSESDENLDLDSLDLPIISQNNVLEFFSTLERRISNLCYFLSTMLRTKHQKISVSTSDILKLLCRCFEITLQNKTDQSARGEHLEKMLMKLQVSFTSVLDGLIIGFGPDLLSNAIPILQFIQQALVWTDKALSKQQTLNDLKLVINVRIAAYKSLSTWLKHCCSASSIEWMADKFLPFILKDIIPERKTVVLSVQNTEHMSKKALKKFKTRQQETDIDDSQNNQAIKSESTSDPNLCIEALTALQKIVSKGNYLLKSQFYETVEAEIIPFLYYLYTGHEQTNNYKQNMKCRIELLRTLKALLLTPHPQKPLPLANSIEIFKLAENDDCQEIAEEAELVLNVLEKIGHPCAPSMLLPVSLSSLKRNSTCVSEDIPQKKRKSIPLLTIPDNEKETTFEQNNQIVNVDAEQAKEINSQTSNTNCSQNLHEVFTQKPCTQPSSEIDLDMEKSNSEKVDSQKDVEQKNNNNDDEDQEMREITMSKTDENKDNTEHLTLTSQESIENPNAYLTLKELQVTQSTQSSSNDGNLLNTKDDSQKSEKNCTNKPKENDDDDEVDDILKMFHSVPKDD